jgi:transcriptional regulator with XRE-family HTH domain
LGRKKENINPEIGQRIKEIRKQQNLTQPQFGERFNVTEQTIRNWESGRRKVDLETIQKICDAFHCDVSYILGIQNILEKSIDSGIDELKNESNIFISYLESIGFSVDIQPTSASPQISNDGAVVTNVHFRYEVTGDNTPKVFSENEWSELQGRISKMIKLLIN